MSSYYDNPFIGGIQIADASNNNVMWEPEVLDDTYVNHDGIRKDGTRGSTIEPHTDESRNKIWFKSLPRDPASRVIWDMVPTDYHYLKQYEPEPRKIRLPEDGISDEVTNAFLGSFINDDLISRTNYGDLKNWEQDILQEGLNVRSGSSWQNELRRLKDMYPGFVPRV